MKQRIVTGLIGGTGFLYLVWVGGIPYATLIGLIAVIGYFELLKMNNTRIYSVEGFIGFTSVILIIFARNPIIKLLHKLDVTTIILWTVIIYLLISVITKNRVTFEHIGFYLLGILYVGFGFSYMLETRLMNEGLYLTFLILGATWASDSGAYFVGKYFGKNKLWPVISPNKTIEGSIGGVLFAILTSLLINYFIGITDNILFIIWAAFIISVTGQIGDLVESALKRAKNVKDSGSLLPGHGGVLDRFDSLIFAFPILHILYII